jgi:hypothetical protein
MENSFRKKPRGRHTLKYWHIYGNGKKAGRYLARKNVIQTTFYELQLRKFQLVLPPMMLVLA